ncbi:MAG: energy transducer TonB [Spirochaetota bacterium]
MRRFFSADNLPFSFTGSVAVHFIVLILIVLFYRPDAAMMGRQTSIVVSDDVRFYANPDFRAKGSAPGMSRPDGGTKAALADAGVTGLKEDSDIRPDDIVIDNKKTAGGDAKTDTRSALEKLSDYLKGTDDDSLFSGGEKKSGGNTAGDNNAEGVQWDGNARGMPVYRDDPLYPAALAGSGIAGTVLVAVKVAPDGRVFSPSVIKSSGYNEFDRNAVAAARTYRFRAIAGDRIDSGTLTIRFVPK